MRPLSQNTGTHPSNEPLPSFRAVPALALLIASASALGCGSAVTSSPAVQPPPATISVTVTPAGASLLLGNTQAFTPTVTGTTDTTVSWSVNGVVGGSPLTGTVNASGVYTAPLVLSTLTTVTVTAQSIADATKQACVTITILSDVTISLTPPSIGVELGAIQPFHATIGSTGHPDIAIRWSISGPSCPSACGSLDASGNYTAPQILPTPATVTLTAQSLADPYKQASATITITSNFSLQLSAPSSVASGGSTTIAATLTPVAGSNPATTLSWTLSGPRCSGTSCGVLTVVTTQALGGGAMSTSATYTAPVTPPNPNTVTITVTPQADPTKKQAVVTILPGVGVTLAPGAATLTSNHRITFTAQVFGATNSAVTWTVNAIAHGTGTVGQICVVASNPCQPLTTGNNLQVDYQAPRRNPHAQSRHRARHQRRGCNTQRHRSDHCNQSRCRDRSTVHGDARPAGRAAIFGHSARRQQSKCRLANSRYRVLAGGRVWHSRRQWHLHRSRVRPVAKHVHYCGRQRRRSLAIRPRKSHHCHRRKHPCAPPRQRLCRSSQRLHAARRRQQFRILLSRSRLDVANRGAADVSNPGNLAVQIRNPDNSTSNSVSLLVVAPNASDEVISLTSATPAATAKNIIVVDATTAGVSVPNANVDLNVAALGAFSTATNSCSLGGNPLLLQRPATGLAAADICLFSASGLDTGMAYAITGPGDVTVNSQADRRPRHHPSHAANLSRRNSWRAHALHSKHQFGQNRRHRRLGGAVMSFAERRRFLWLCLLGSLILLALTAAAFANGTTLARLRFEDLAQQSSAVCPPTLPRLRISVGPQRALDRNPLRGPRAQQRPAPRNRHRAHHRRHLRSSAFPRRRVPVFRPGEEVYPFLWQRPGELYRVLGWAQGTFRITRNVESGNETVTQDSALAPIFDPRTRAFRHGGIRNLPVGIFQLKLRRALEQQN